MFTHASKTIQILMLAGFSALAADQAVAQVPQYPYGPLTSNSAPAPDLYSPPFVPWLSGAAGGSGGPVYYYYGAYDAYRYPGLGVWNPGPIYYSGSPYAIDVPSPMFPRNQGMFGRPRNRYGWW
jgi:hypothetical protein